MSMMGTVAPWDSVARGYSDVTMGLFQGYSDAALELIPLQGSHHIADIGCGPGTLALAAADKVAKVTAVDFSEEMIALLAQTLSSEGIGNIDPHHGDGQSLPFDDSVFDASFSMFGLMFFPDRAKGYAQLHRTLKPGGHVCVSSWAALSRSPLLETMFRGMQKINPDIPDPRYDETSLENPEILKAELSGAGFREIVIHEVEDSTDFASAEAFWNDMVKGTAPIVMMRKSIPDDIWQERSARAVEHVEAIAGPFPTRLSATALLGHGVR